MATKRTKKTPIEPEVAPVPEIEVPTPVEVEEEVAAVSAEAAEIEAEEDDVEVAEDDSEDEDFDEEEESDEDEDFEDDEDSDEDFDEDEDEDESDDEEDEDEESDDEDDSDEDDSDDEESEDEDEEEADFVAKPRPPAKLERLQKILAQAGVASRRKAEEMIEQGRVQVNGKTVTELGTKADLGRDHIRVDGKLLQGAERLRYYVLNKPKGFVTTVKDPEGRPTVMQFFEKMRERLYPVGRLDYMSEGLLLVTNDGELANRLTRAASGVEKTYLVKVSGRPTEDELDTLRAGVSIERGKPGEGRVRTSPARIRQVREGDNPWYEVVLIEGRNRELRKMFEEVGHFVEKIRRIGYGPLVLDQEPGSLRELDTQELDLLRQAAAGTLRTPKSKELRRRNSMDSQLPTIQPYNPNRPPQARPDPRTPRAANEYQGKKAFDKSARPARPAGDRPARSSEGFRPANNRPNERGDYPARRPATFGKSKFGSDRPAARPAWQKDAPPVRFEGNQANSEGGESRPFTPKPFEPRAGASRSFDKPTSRPFGDRPARPAGDKPAASFSDRPKTFGEKPAGRGFDRPAGKSFGDRPSFGDRQSKNWGRPAREDKGEFNRKQAPPQRADDDFSDLGPVKQYQFFIEPVQGSDRPSGARSNAPRPISDRPYSERSARPSAPRPSADRPYQDRSGSDRGSSDRPSAPRPFVDRSSSPRPSSDRPQGDRPSFNRGGSDRPSSGRPSFGRPGAGRPSYGGSNSDRPASGRPSYGGSNSDRSGSDRSGSDRPSYGGSNSTPRPPRAEGERRFTTSSGQPRAGGPRPSSKPGKTYGAGAGRPSSGGSRPSFGGKPGGGFSRPGFSQSRPAFRRDDNGPSASRPSSPRSEGSSDFRPSAKPYSAPRGDRKPAGEWKPSPRYGGTGKPAGGGSRPSGGSRPGGSSRPGGFSKPGGSRPGGSGFKPGGSRPSGGRPGGYKRG